MLLFLPHLLILSRVQLPLIEMKFLLPIFLASSLSAAQLTVVLQPQWHDQLLALNETSLSNRSANQFSITRIAFLLSKAQLQQQDGKWIGANDWFAFIDVEKKQTTFSLPNIPAGLYTALRFDLGLDDSIDKSEPSPRPAGHPLHPDTNNLHWGWRKGYIFLALEGRYQQKDGKLGGFSYHLAGQECRGTVEVPVSMDLRTAQVLRLSFDASYLFDSAHAINIHDSDTTHSGNDGGLAGKITDNALQAFGIISIAPDISPIAQTNKPLVTPAGVSLAVPAHFPVPNWPQDNLPTPAGVKLGEMLFHEARFSLNNQQSCASCHQSDKSFTDGLKVSIGTTGQHGTRNAMPLTNLAWKPAYFWDGRANTLREQVLMPIEDKNEMNESLDRVVTKINDRQDEFAKAFGTKEITKERIGLALEQYLLTLIAAESKMDHTITKGAQLSQQEARGMELFFTESDPGRGVKGADCFHCHGGAHFTNNQFLNNGLDLEDMMIDLGRMRVTSAVTDRGKFVVPSLRNVARTAPYMHDGRFATLEEVIAHYNSGIQASATLDPNLAKHLGHGGLNLTKDDQAALVAFLKALSDE